jgi:hypothetical protein
VTKPRAPNQQLHCGQRNRPNDFGVSFLVPIRFARAIQLTPRARIMQSRLKLCEYKTRQICKRCAKLESKPLQFHKPKKHLTLQKTHRLHELGGV